MSAVAGYIDKHGSGTIEREFLRTQGGTFIAVDRILWYTWDAYHERIVVKLDNAGLSSYYVDEAEAARVGITK